MISETKDLHHYLHKYQLTDFFPEAYHDRLQLVTYDKDQPICQQGEKLTSLSYFIEGEIKIVRRLFNGKEHILETRTHPSLIGDIEIMTGRGAVSSVIPLKESLLIQLPLTDKDALLQDPLFLYQLGRNLAQTLYQQNIVSSTNISYSVKERLATHILTVENSGAFQLDLPVLADSLGTSYRHLMRVIKQLIDQNIIDKPAFKHYRIRDKKALESLTIQD